VNVTIHTGIYKSYAGMWATQKVRGAKTLLGLLNINPT